MEGPPHHACLSDGACAPKTELYAAAGERASFGLLAVIRLRRRDQQGGTHIPAGVPPRQAMGFREVNGFLTRFAILCARKASSESPHGYTSSQDSEKDSTCGT